ncbi:MAG TPA: amino acid permease [Alphaproteobacteria bacterium]|nr:amino acid permease [Alphaproteobacteria bacterium]
MIKNFFQKKPVATILAEAESKTLVRSLNGFHLIAFGIGAIIGAGIFVLSGKAAAEHAGPAVVLSFVLAGLACAFAALCYAELASVLPVSGSAYTYAYATMGELVAWCMAWLLILEYGLTSSIVASGWSGYFLSLLRDFGITFPPEYTAAYGEVIKGSTATGIFNVPAFLALLLVSILLSLGVKESARVNNIIVTIKLVVIMSFIIIGAFYVDPANWTPFIPENEGVGKFGYDGILKGAGMIFFAYIGFEMVSTAAQETVNPQKNIPIGIIGSLIICTIIYIAVAMVMTGIVSYKDLGVPDPIALAVDKIGLGWFSLIIKIGAIAGLSTVMLIVLYGQTRIFYMVSKDGLIPPIFSKIHPKFKTPFANTYIVGFFAALAAGLTPLSKLGDLVSMGTLFAFCVVCFTVLYLRKSQPDLNRPFVCPGAPVVPILGIASCLYLIYGIGWSVFVTLKIYFIAGIVIYLLYGQFKSKLSR